MELTAERRTPSREAAIPVLLYHSVADAPPEGQVETYTVTPARFREHIAVIVESGRIPMTVSELAAALKGDRPLPVRPIVVTFDDGFEDTVAATAWLREADIPSTVYVTAGTIGTAAGISPSNLRILADAGVEVGAHSVSHPHLDELPAARAAREIAQSREQLEHHLGERVASFAYPHGAYDRGVRAAVVTAGFSSAAAVKNAFSHAADDPFAIARWTVTHGTTAAALARIVAGSDARIVTARERYRTRASRTARRLRRRVRTLVASSEATGGAHP